MTILRGRIELENSKKYSNEPKSSEICSLTEGRTKGYAIASHTVLFDEESWVVLAFDTEAEAMQEFERQVEFSKKYNSLFDEAILYNSFKTNKAEWCQYARLINN